MDLTAIQFDALTELLNGKLVSSELRQRMDNQGRSLSRSAFSNLMLRLRKNGMVEDEEEANPPRGRVARLVFTLTPAGRTAWQTFAARAYSQALRGNGVVTPTGLVFS